MKNRFKKLPKKRQNSDYWIYGHHAVIGALNNNNREKYEINFTFEAEKKLIQKVDIKKYKFAKRNKTREEIENLLGGISNHQGVCLRVEKLKMPELKEFIDNCDEENSIIVLLDQLEDSQNVGAIFRSALAFKLDGIILTQDNSVSENSFLTKAASSGIDKVPFTKIKNISSCIKKLKESGYWIYGLEMSAEKSLKETKFAKKVVIILGSENKGLRKITTSLCDEVIKIDISDELESLNVSNTAAIAFYEISSSTLKS